ncbi:nucleoside hydrolase [Streptomyces sp. G45]|uniref:nucleoside hydrolase n=1 Tax=Streptomyces sp. G45 TaxID=3406627 RepID=UPI003C20544A
MASAAAPHSTAPLSVVVDTDPGVDDAWALLYLAAQPGVEIVAVGAAHGNVPTRQAAENALRVLDAAGLTDVPVAVGHPGPLAQPVATAEFVHGADGLGGQAGPASARRPVAESAAEQLVRLARERPGELTLLALAPLTNVALALRMEPRLPRLLRGVVHMGGAIRVPGNYSPWADANTGHDPEAAEEVMRAGFALTLVPLDVTQGAWADGPCLDEVAAAPSATARFASRILDTYVGIYSSVSGARGCVMHDPLAAAILLDEQLAQYEERQVVVELVGHCRGATLVDDRPFTTPDTGILDGRPPVRIAAAADTATALERIRKALVTGPATA